MNNDPDVHYRVLTSPSTGLTVAGADYSRVKGLALYFCQVIVIFKNPSDLHVVREVRFQKTDADVPTFTSWSPIDIADANGDGNQELVLEGDSYEDHWFEVVSVGTDLSTHMIFRGLGYYL